MANFSQNNQANQNVSQKDLLMAKYHNARHNLLLVVIFTAVNIGLLVANANTYFLFSAFIPYALADLGMYLCGMYPAELYGEEIPEMVFFDKTVFAVFMVIAVVFIVLYLLSWIFSKKPRVGWLIFALVIFAIDTLGMFALTGFAVDSIVDIIFHVWVIVSLISAISAYFKAKKLPDEAPVIEAQAEEVVEATEDAPSVEETPAVSKLNGEDMN